MKQSFLLFTLLFCLNSADFAQTGVVAHRSHSGSMYAFNPRLIPDNLGWTGFERQTFDTTTLYFINPADTLAGYPYCNNPAMTQDSLNKNYPFYSSALPDSAQKTPATIQEDSLAKHKQRIKSRNEVKENELVPIGEDFYGNPTNPNAPGIGFIASLVLLMTLVGLLIWIFNRKKVMTI
jgi:hypothetical protein